MEVSPRVLWLTPGYPSVGDPFGFVFHQTQARALNAAGLALDVIAPTPWAPWPLGRLTARWGRFAATPRIEQDGSVTVMRPRYPTTPREARLGVGHFAIAARLRALGDRLRAYDVIHAHFAYPIGAAAVAIGSTLGKPVFLTLHGSDVTVEPHSSHRMAKRLRSTLTEASRVFAVSAPLADLAAALSGRRPEVLSTGVDSTLFDAEARSEESRAAARARLDLPEQRPILLFVGALRAEKGVDDLIAALALMRADALCVFVGPGAPRASMRSRFVGAEPHDRIPDYLAAADALVLPSWREGLGQAAVEAGAAGVPVV
ncbi:MAG: glycosyltransferase, partial [Pseudomonadota bacterium]